MAATISHLHRASKCSPKITGVYLSVPILLSVEAVPDEYKAKYLSRQQHKSAPILNQEALALFEECYKPDSISPLYSPFLFLTKGRNDNDQLPKLPPHYFQISGIDPLCDEAMLYEEVLREKYGTATRVDFYAGLPHGFATLWPQADFSKRQARDSVEGMMWLLSY